MKNKHPETKPVAPAAQAAATASQAVAPRRASSPKKRPPQQPSARPGTKKAAILALLQRPKGATLKELVKATEWQAHSVRGFLSGSLGKQMGVKVQVIDRDGERAYQVKS